MLQGARRLISDAHPFADIGQGTQIFADQNFAQVACKFADTCRLRGIVRIMFQRFAIFFHHQAAATGAHHNSLCALFNIWPPGINIAAHHVMRPINISQMLVQGTTATGLGGADQRNAQFIQHACSSSVGIGRTQRLHTTFQYQHTAHMNRLRTG